MKKYQIFTDSSSDLTTEMRKEFNIDYFRMGILVNGKEYPADLDFKEFSPEELYNWVKDPAVKIQTSLITASEFQNRMIPYLEKGMDILYIACTSALSGSVNFFRLAAEELQEKYPERKLIAIDSKRAGMPLGILVMDACKLQNEGKTLEEVLDFVDKEKLKYGLCGTVETLQYLRNAGRVSGAAAFFADLFSIKPVIIADTLGNNYAVEKINGTRKTWNRLVEVVKEYTAGIKNPVIYIGQGMAQEASDYFEKRLTEEIGAKIVKYWVGPIIGISCGPGVIHLAYFGKEVTITSPEKK